jgi:hypothetical protein
MGTVVSGGTFARHKHLYRIRRSFFMSATRTSAKNQKKAAKRTPVHPRLLLYLSDGVLENSSLPESGAR